MSAEERIDGSIHIHQWTGGDTFRPSHCERPGARNAAAIRSGSMLGAQCSELVLADFLRPYPPESKARTHDRGKYRSRSRLERGARNFQGEGERWWGSCV